MIDLEKMPFHAGEAFISFCYIFLPLICGFIHILLKGKNAKKVDIFFLYYLLVGVGIQGFLTGIVQIALPDQVVAIVEWPFSPFLLELGMANLSYGILGIVSIWLKDGWKIASAVGYGIFLLITGIGHVVDLVQNGVTAGAAGTFLFSDLLVAVALFVLVFLRLSIKKREEIAKKEIPTHNN